MKFKMPKYIPSAQVQCELFSLLRQDGKEIYVEHKVDNSRFDLVIIHNDEIKAIIEVKKETKKFKLGKQFEKYNKYGVPLIYCRGRKEIEKTIKEVNKLFI